MTDVRVVLVTAPPGDPAVAMARLLVDERLAACVNILPGVRSIYRWEGKVADEPEELLVIKTDKTRFKELVKAVKAVHPYAVPEVIALRVKEGHRDYLRWLFDAVEAPRKQLPDLT